MKMTDDTKTVLAQRQLDEDLNSQASARAVTNTTGLTGKAFLDAARAQLEAEGWRDDAPKPGPCPAWCVDEPGHDYDSITVEGGSYIRFHSGCDYVFDRDDYNEAQPNGIQKRAPGSVQIAALEGNDGTTVTYGEPVISVWNAEDLNVDECSRAIRALNEAHAELVLITGSEEPAIYVAGVIAHIIEPLSQLGLTEHQVREIWIIMVKELSRMKPSIGDYFIRRAGEEGLLP